MTGQNVTSGEPIASTLSNGELNLTIVTTGMGPTSATVSTDAFTMSALFNGDPSFPGSASSPTGDAEAEATSRNTTNATRYCDDCLESEVCVALVDEQVPICRGPRDREDPTGCAGFCIINKQKCHRLDVDAFRFVVVLVCFHLKSLTRITRKYIFARITRCPQGVYGSADNNLQSDNLSFT